MLTSGIPPNFSGGVCLFDGKRYFRINIPFGGSATLQGAPMSDSEPMAGGGDHVTKGNMFRVS